MRIAFDIDGVITDEPSFLEKYAVPFFRKRYGKEVCNPDALRVRDMFGCSSFQEKMFRLKYVREYVIDEPARPGMRELFHQLIMDGDTPYIVTHRDFSDMKNVMGKWMRKSVEDRIEKDGLYPQPQEKKIIYAPKGSDKSDICLANDISILIDDNSHIISANSKKGIYTIKFNAKHNMNCVGERIYPASTVSDIYPLIQKIKGIVNKGEHN